MGFFSRTPHRSWALPRIPKITDPRLRDFNFLRDHSIESLYPVEVRDGPIGRDAMTITIANRLASMTHRLERHGQEPTAQVVRWYLKALGLGTPVADMVLGCRPVDRAILDPLVTRATAALTAYETRVGYTVDTGTFDRLVGPSVEEWKEVVFGPPMWLSTYEYAGGLPPSATAPGARLTLWLANYCWRWTHSASC
jgi:hypothetical protein